MAKPIPKRAKRNKEIERQLEIFKAATQARYDVARTTFDAQSEKTQEIITRIQRILCIGANGIVRVWVNGDKRQSAGVTITVDMDYVQMNAFYMAIEILKDLAFMDVRVEDFEFPEAFCAECGVKLNDRGKGKKKKRKKGD